MKGRTVSESPLIARVRGAGVLVPVVVTVLASPCIWRCTVRGGTAPPAQSSLHGTTHHDAPVPIWRARALPGRRVVLAAVTAWPAIEVCRLIPAKGQSRICPTPPCTAIVLDAPVVFVVTCTMAWRGRG